MNRGAAGLARSENEQEDDREEGRLHVKLTSPKGIIIETKIKHETTTYITLPTLKRK